MRLLTAYLTQGRNFPKPPPPVTAAVHLRALPIAFTVTLPPSPEGSLSAPSGHLSALPLRPSWQRCPRPRTPGRLPFV